jgi:hypothetical protein
VAGTFIKVDAGLSTQKFAADLMQFIQTVRTTMQQGDAIKARMDYMHDGTDFSDLETQFGLPIGTGQIIYDLCNGTIGSMRGAFQTANAVELIARVG